MAVVELREPAAFAGAFLYEQTDIPPGQTLTDWRRERVAHTRAADAQRRAARRQRARALLTLRPARSRRAVAAPVGTAR